MLSRRDFVKTAAVGASAVQCPHPVEGHGMLPTGPLRADPQRRSIFAKLNQRGGLRLYTDGSPEPRPLIHTAALDRAFGKGVGQTLRQPDHWRMIDEGLFFGDDIFLPSEPGSWEHDIWQENYAPECEAHDLLLDLFQLRMPSIGGHCD